MFWLAIVAGIIVAPIAIAAAVGAALPRDHVAAVRAYYAAPPEAVWALLADVAGARRWRAELKGIELLPDADGKRCWVEHSKFGDIPYVMEVSDPPRRMVRRIANPDLPYGGEWEFILTPFNGGCDLSIAERGFVKPPLFRFMSRYLFGYESSLTSMARSLGQGLGETVIPAIVKAGDLK